MSTPAPPKAPGGVHPTRRQLEELESLIQHMLTLPVNQAEKSAAATAEKVPGVNGAPLLRPSDGTAVAELPGPDGHAENGVAEYLPDQAVRMPAQETDTPALAGPPGYTAPEGSARGLPPQIPPTSPVPGFSDKLLRPQTGLPDGKPEAGEATGLFARVWGKMPSPGALVGLGRRMAAGPRGLLVWTDRGFDWLMLQLGPPGRWLRGPWGRAALGWTGLALLAAAVVWGVLGWCGWTW